MSLPAHWTAQPHRTANNVDNSLNSSWWRSFGDTNLSTVILEALQNNHDLKVFAARLDAAVAEARIAGAALFPQASLGFGAQRQQQVFVGLPIPGAGDQVLKSRATAYGVDLNISWELDLWGRVRAARRSALQDVQASASDWEAARHSVAAQTAKAWLALTEAERQLQLANASAKSHGRTAQQIRERYKRGIRTPLDVRLAAANESNSRALVQLRQSQVQAARRQLEILMARYPSGTISGGADLPEVPAPVPAGLPSELLKRRPDIAAAERRVDAATSRVREAKAALFPRIALTATGGRTSSELEDLLKNDFNVWAIAGNLAQPLLEGGRLRANVKRNEARAREALEQYRQTVLRALGEVETALAAELLFAERERDLAEAARQSQSASRLAEQRYHSGLEEFITLLEAQRRALEAESALIAIRRERLDNRINLHLALGGGFGNLDFEPPASDAAP
jgi:outer membrane protein, multidrug efflux system